MNLFVLVLERIILHPGFEEDYDRAEEGIRNCEEQLEVHLEAQRDYFQHQNIHYKHLGKKPYQLEIPADVLQRKPVPHSFELVSQVKGGGKKVVCILLSSVLFPSLLDQSCLPI